ncbi:MAG: ABC transporter ATP-binding protein [Tidjanibacter sp.]|nr:ABC transporter ATP-binding protein [Tidjanibacter sp.]
MESKRIINIKGLSVEYDRTTALKDVNIEFFSDDFVGIIGPNGGGKSSLVKSILGLIPYTGTIEFEGGLQSNHQIGYMPQVNPFDKSFPISVRELVLSGLQGQRGFGRYTKSDNVKAEEILKQLGIEQLKDRQIGELSGGELQRALLGRAIISEPKLLILDEPANFVDNEFENELYHLLAKLNERMAVIIISHDVGTITTFVKNVVCVNRTVHRHTTAELTPELLENYHCPIQVVSHGVVPHTVLAHHDNCCHREHQD